MKTVRSNVRPITRLSGVAVGVTAVAFALAACGGGSSAGDGGGTSTEKPKLAFVIKPLDNTYFGAMAKGAQAEADKQGVQLTISAAQNVTDDSGQASKLNSLVTAGYDCYIVNPTSGTNLLTGLAPVSKDGKPIVNLDYPIDTDAASKAGVKLTTYVGTNNETAGAAGGDAMVAEIAANSKVALIGGLAGDPGSEARLKGFKDKVSGKLDVIQTVAADFDKAKAKQAAATLLRAHSDLKGFFTPSGDMALGIQQAVEEAGKDDKVAVIGVDGTEDQLKDIKAGGEPAAVEQFPYLMGVQSVQACLAAIDGKSIPTKVETPVLVVNKDNVDAALENYPAPPADFEVPNPFEG
ncbi:substrate-binding domain-containing protein [Spongisporangium articulatum]|uniref:Substrate-binding domain-containing protein n=1 Tax=Spongisporangium articulatum TaxID=3362603 RepID=A0ABW8AQ85_9ACTN